MSQENKYPNYPQHEPRQIAYWQNELQKLIDSMQRRGLVATIELEYTDVAMGHYRMVPHVRGARTLAHDKAANRAIAAADLDPLLLVPTTYSPTKELSGNSFHIDEAAQLDTRRWFEQNGFSLVVFAQVMDAVYSLRIRPRAFDSFKRTQHAITLPQIR